MHQHLVDDHLEEQRRDQAEQLQEERGEQHLAQEMAIFVDRPQEPGDVEPAGDVRQSGAAGHQDQPAVPDRQQLVPRHQGRPGRQRRLDQDLVLVGLGDQQEPAIAQGRDGGQGRAGKPGPVGPIGTCLEPEIPGAPEHLRCADLVRSEPMRDLSGIGRNALEVQQRHKGFETGIGWSRAVGFGAHWCSPGRRRVRACGCASSGVLAWRRIGNRHRAVTFTRRDEARRHELAQQGGTAAGEPSPRSVAHQGLDDDVVAGSAVEDVLPAIADQHVISGAAAQGVVAGAADQDVVAVAAIGGELHAAAKPGRIDDVIAAEAIDDDAIGRPRSR